MTAVHHDVGPSTLTVVLVLAVVLTSCAWADNSRRRLFRALPATTDQLSQLSRLLERQQQRGDVDVWLTARDVDRAATFAVHEDDVAKYAAWMAMRSIPFELDANNLQELIERSQEVENSRTFRRSVDAGTIDLDSYNSHQDINDFLREMEAICRDHTSADVTSSLECNVEHIGNSYEGRSMNVLVIGSQKSGKPYVWLDAGIHAREWIASATALKFVKKIIDGYVHSDPDVRWLLDNYVLFILPNANPDGYMFSRTDDRMWRKTRKPTNKLGCIGSDPNRNWRYKWGVSGVNLTNPCSEIYPGTRPFSENETRNMRNYLLRNRCELLVYLSLHSYGQYWLYPWGYDTSLPDDADELDRVGQRAVDAIYDTYGKQYTMGSSARVLYAASGASDDWAKGVANITYSYTVELRPTSDNVGFLLPESEIHPTSEEFYNGFMAMMVAIDEKPHSVEDC